MSQPRGQWNTQGKGGVSAAKAVVTQGEGSVSAAKAVETQGEGSVLPPPPPPPPDGWMRCTAGRSVSSCSGVGGASAQPAPRVSAAGTSRTNNTATTTAPVVAVSNERADRCVCACGCGCGGVVQWPSHCTSHYTTPAHAAELGGPGVSCMVASCPSRPPLPYSRSGTAAMLLRLLLLLPPLLRPLPACSALCASGCPSCGRCACRPPPLPLLSPPAPNEGPCSTTSKGMSLWRDCSRSARKGRVSLNHRIRGCRALPQQAGNVLVRRHV